MFSLGLILIMNTHLEHSEPFFYQSPESYTDKHREKLYSLKGCHWRGYQSFPWCEEQIVPFKGQIFTSAQTGLRKTILMEWKICIHWGLVLPNYRYVLGPQRWVQVFSFLPLNGGFCSSHCVMRILYGTVRQPNPMLPNTQDCSGAKMAMPASHGSEKQCQGYLG